MSNRQQSGPGLWAVTIIIVLVGIILFLLWPQLSALAEDVITPTVNVTGHVSTAGFTQVPTHVDFVAGRMVSTVAIGRNGNYSIKLQNGQEYNITVAWSAIGGLSAGNCTAGTLNLRAAAREVAYNISC